MARAKMARSGGSEKKSSTSTLERVSRPGNNGGSLPLTDLESEIRLRAYELYERRGRLPGLESEDWLIAEREIAARYQGQSA